LAQGGELTGIGASDYAREPWDINVAKSAKKNVEPLAPGESTGSCDHRDTWFQFQPPTQPGNTMIITTWKSGDSVGDDYDLAVRRQHIRYGA
jgi:hypothetical protein